MDTPVYYFEPNTVDYEAEDLCLGIALEVQYFDRALNGGKTLTGSVDMPLKPNILGGENNFLTTSYTDITVLELEGGGNKESIGIESIDIKYNSWYLPEVNIKFVDIRGNSVFNPMELTNNTESRDRAKGSFLKGFFMFPYPIFILTVKGYFGKPITFRLTVKGVPQAQLNAQTGNFEITVGFIGHMYYYLTDIPMSLLMIAPYISYGGVDGTLISYNNGVREKTLPTFVDFVKNTNAAMVELSQNSTYSAVEVEKEDLIANLEQFELLKNYLEKVENNINKFWIKVEERKEDNILIIKRVEPNVYSNEGTTIEDVVKQLFVTYLQEMKRIEERITFESENKLIFTQNNSEYNMALIKYIPTSDIDDIIKKLNSPNPNNTSIKKAQKDQYKGKIYEDVGLGREYAYFNGDEWVVYPGIEIKANFDKDRETINKEIEIINKEIENLDIRKQDAINDVYDKKYGIIPTIKNIFSLTLAHLHKLHENVKACIENIDSESNIRQLSKIREITDINTQTEELTVYPFTGFFNSENETLWIGSTSASNFSEASFVNKVFSGMTTYSSDMTKAEEAYLNNKAFTTELPPSGLISLYSDIGEENEYYTKLQEQCGGDLLEFCNAPANSLPPAMLLFIDRYIKALLTTTDVQYVKESFPVLEAYKLLSCGWDERIYNTNTVWGSDSEIPQIDLYIQEIKKKIKSLTTELEKCEREQLFYKYDSREIEFHNGDWDFIAEQTITKREFSPIKLTQFKHHFVTYHPSAAGDNNKRTMTQYYKMPQEIKTLDSSIQRKIDTMKEFCNDNGIKHIDDMFKIRTFKLLYEHDSKFNDYYVKILQKEYKTKDDIIRNLPINVSTESGMMKWGGIVKISKLLLLKLIVWSRNKKDFDICFTALSEGLIDSNGTYKGYEFKANTALSNGYYYYFKRLEELTNFAKENEDIYFERIKSAASLNQNDFIAAIKNMSLETIEFILPYYLANAEFNFSLGITASDEWDEVEVSSSADNNVKNLNAYYANGVGLNLFIDTIRKYIRPQIEAREALEETSTEEKVNEIKATTIKKIAIYDIFKNLYDRWKFGAEDFMLGYNNNLTDIGIGNFLFRDALNRDISEKLQVNIDKFIEHIFAIYKGEKDMSLYEFFFEICSDVNCLLLALPLNSFEAIKSNNDMKQMFTPLPYSSVINNPISSTFVVTYRQKDSQHLNYHPNESAYKDDGIEFTNYISSSENGGENGLGVFGVTYGMGKQSYFKNIISSMDKPKVTEQTIASTLSIAEQGAKNSSRNYGVSSHDVFDTYSQHSYHCSVETMGNMQIMPMMYFQLNNIPLFKGGYFITSVEHSINKDGMKTTFKGNRLSQNQIQLLRSGKFEINIDNSYNTPNTGSGSVSNTNVRSYPALTYTKENTLIVVYAGRAMSDPYYESPDLSKDSAFNNIKGNTEEEEYILTPHDSNNNPVTKKYREYWGNRKIAMSLISKLQEAGYEVETAFYDERSAQEKKFSTSYTQNWGGVERNTIAVCIYSDEITNIDENGNVIAPNWGTNKQWVIYKQNKDGEYDPATRQFIKKPYHLVSDKLAQCIASKMSTALSGNANIVVNTKPQVNESRVTWKGITDFEMPSVLSKNLFHTTKEHVKFLAKKENRELIAQAHFDGIEQFFKDMEGKNSRMLNTDGNEVWLSQYFTYSELTRTDQIDPETKEKMINIPNEAEEQNLITLATTILDKVREKYGKPIWVESGFRCEKVNTAVKGKAGSQHRTGSAADLYALDMVHNAPIFWAAYDLIQSGEITVGQLIWEYGNNTQPGWVHISLPNRASGKTNEFLRYYIGQDGKEHSKPFKVDEYIRVDE